MDFLTHFGLNRQPFAGDSQGRDYYQAAVPAKTLIRLQGMIIEGDRKEIVVAGGVGSGKSMAALKLVESLSPDAYSCVLIPDRFVDRIDYVAGIIQSVWGDIASGDSSRLDALRESGVEPILVLDSADRLAPGSMELIENLARDHEVTLIKIGSYDTADLKLNSWEDSAIARLIVHRIKAAGSQSPLFDKQALLHIVRCSEGNPGEAIRACAAALLATWLSSSDQVSVSVAEHLLGDGGQDLTETMLEPDHSFTPDANLEDPAIGIETSPPVPVDEETEAGYDLEETDVALDLDLDPQGDDSFLGQEDETDDGEDVTIEETEDVGETFSVLDSGEATNLQDLADDLEHDLDLTGTLDDGTATDVSGEVSQEAAMPVDDEDDLDAMLAEFGGDEVTEEVVPEESAQETEEDASFDLDAEFAGLVDDVPEEPLAAMENDVSEAEHADDADDADDVDNELDDAFAAFADGEAEVSVETPSAESEDEDLDAMLADLTVDEPSPVVEASPVALEAEEAVSDEATPVEDDNPPEVIDDDLEAELDDLLKEFGDL